MRLVFVNSAWAGSWGGGEKWTVEAAEWFGAHGHEARVVGRPDSRLLTAARERGLETVATRFGGDLDPAAIWRARTILRDARAELAAVNFNKEAWQFGLAAKTLGIPVVARHGFGLFKRSFYHRVLAGGVMDTLVVNARSIRERYRELGFATDRIAVIHNGTGIVAAKPGELRRRFGIGTDERLILAAGRLESQKRFDRIVEIAETLLPQFPRVRFLIAGDGPLENELKTKIAARGLTTRVTLTGFLPDFAEVAGDAELFLLTSDDEGTPNVLLEAMAAGVACVSFDVGAVPEILGGELAGNVIAAGDVAAMSARVRLLLGDDELRRQTAAAMREHVEREFSTDVSMRRFEELFKNTLGRKR